MTEQISNKELARRLLIIPNVATMSCVSDEMVEIAAERLAAMPDHIPDTGKMIVRDVEANKTTGEQEPLCFIMKTGINILNDGCGKAHVWKQSVNSDYEVPLYTQPQQPAPSIGPTEHQVYNWFQEATIKHHIKEDGSHISARANYVAQQAWNAARSTPDRETIKRYCLEFVAWYLRNYLKEDNPQDVIDLWWQKQSAEGGE